MALVGTTNEEKIWNFLKGEGMSDQAVAGIMGNLYAECGLRSNNLQGSYEKKLGYTDETYTAAVDSGKYKNFEKDSAGYGLAQWTYHTRKAALLAFAKEKKKSIGDLEMQLEFLMKELKGDYKKVLDELKKASSVLEASNIILTKFERPADQGESVQQKRAGYGQTYFEKYGGTKKMTEQEIRQNLVATAKKYIGCKESDGSHRQIIDIYNGHKPLARGYKVTYTDAWCATYVSAMSVLCGLTDIMPTECGCSAMIALYQKMGRWMENDAYVPTAGDIIMYDWQDSGAGDNQGGADHVGIVIGVSGNTMTIIEGNMSNKVGTRELAINGKYIRGFCLPDFASKATSKAPEQPQQPSQPSQPAQPSSGGTTLNRNPQWVGEVTADSLNCRTWAGKSASRLVSYPEISKGTLVDVCDSIKASDGSTWYYVRINGKLGYKYGFVHSGYIKKHEDKQPAPAAKEYKIGDQVKFTGSTHYTSSYAGATGKPAKACNAKITNMNLTGAHPYHVQGNGVYGWVNIGDITV